MDYRDKLKYSINNKFLILIVLGILILVNVLSLQLFARFDWTENKQFSISDSTVDILSNLEDLVTVKVFFSPDLPSQLKSSELYVKDILSEYKAYGSGNFDYEFVNVSDASGEQEASQSGVQKVEMQVLENDRYQVRNGFFGLSLSYEGKSESIPVIQQKNLGSLEYDLTSLIVKLSQSKLQVLAFLQGHGEHGIIRSYGAPKPDVKNDYSTLADALRKNYEVKTVDFSKNQTLDDVDVLVLAGPERDLSDRDIFEIDQFLLNGGRLISLVDAVRLLPGSVNVEPLEINSRTFLSPLGVTVNSNLVLDSLAEFATFQVGPGRSFIVPYAFFVRLVSDNFSNNPVVQKIQSFTVRFASTLSIEEKDGLEYDSFVNTSPSSWAQDGPSFQTDPNNVPKATQDQMSAKTLAVSISGMFPRISDFNSVPPLQESVKNDEGEYVFENVSPDDFRSGRKILKEAKNEAKIIVFSDSDFVSDQSVQGSSTPVVLFQNMVDYLALGDDLISIRSKTLTDAPIEELSDAGKSLTKFLGILLIPLLVSFYGVFRLWLRRKEEKMLKL